MAPGDKLGKYHLIRQIAVGGMAELYLARTLGIEGFEKLVVVKRILPQYVANASFVEMFLNEARIAATLHHPNIAQVYDIGVDEGDYFFAMEYVHGEDLDRVSVTADEQGVPLSLDASLTLIAHLCSALHYAHERVGPDGRPLSIVHRDVSPTNVLVSYDGAVKLVDFGIARAGTRPGKTTQSGLKGKIAYMSPEQCRSTGHLDRRSDIFAVGMLLYELTTGQPPFTGESEYQVLEQIVNRDAPSPRMIVPEYPEMLERIVLTTLARDPAARFPTALALQTALEDFAHERRLRVSPLVLSRLMSTLFPARLEEWDEAKSQGAFFVEQHVVRTLIEAGKAADGVPEAPELPPPPATDDDPTAVTGPPPADGTPPPRRASAPRIATPRIATPIPGPRASSPALPIPAPRTSSPALPIPAPRTSSPALPIPAPRTSSPALPAAAQVAPMAPPTPVPGMPGAVPILTMAPAVRGSLVSSSNAPIPVPAVADVTEFVRTPTDSGSSPRRSIALVVGGLALAGGIAAFVALHGGPPVVPTSGSASSEAASPAPPPEPTLAPAAVTGSAAAATASATDTAPAAVTGSAAAATASATATDTATGSAADTATASATDAATGSAADTAADTATDSDTDSAPASPPPHHHTSHPHNHHSEPSHHATPHHATKEPSWNADSPFMPVRESH